MKDEQRKLIPHTAVIPPAATMDDIESLQITIPQLTAPIIKATQQNTTIRIAQHREILNSWYKLMSSQKLLGRRCGSKITAANPTVHQFALSAPERQCPKAIPSAIVVHRWLCYEIFLKVSWYLKMKVLW